MLKISDIYLGKTDAKNELLNSDPSEADRFLDAYVKPPALDLSCYTNREKYFVVGLKGTGKTALLRYISLKLQSNDEAISIFTLFKSEVDEDLRKDFSKASRVQLATENSDLFDGDDFESVWRWFIYRKIAEACQTSDRSCFQPNGNLSRFLSIVTSEALTDQEVKGLMRLVPRVRKGHIEISKSPKLGFDLEWDVNGKAKINFNALVKKADHAFSELDPDVARINLFFDELELNYSTTKQYQRDSRLVRDLIVSVEKINGTSKAKAFNLCLYAAIRSEVLNSVDALGKEINKPIADFGAEILWNRPGLDATQQPLLHIVEQRINNARIQNGLSALSSEEIWSSYFPKEVHGLKPQVYLLHNSWYRPRDIVRLLISAQEQYPDETTFNIQALEAVRKKYSTASWIEMTEELKAKYKASDIDGIKYILYGFKQISTLSDLDNRAVQISADHREASDLLQKVSLKEVLRDLYRVGIIGNINRNRTKMRFSFRGDDEILFDHDIFIHNALRAYLSI